MADNIAVTPGSGANIAADDVGGILYQRVKVGVGVDGSATDLAFGQAAKANSLPVAFASDHFGPATKAGSLSVTLATDLLGPQTKANAQAVSFATDALGAATKANSLSVAFATDGLGVATKAASLSVAFASDQLGQAAAAASLPVVLASDQTALAVNQQSSSYSVTDAFTRPANTTAYPANSVVGGVRTLTLANPVGNIPTNSAVIINAVSFEYDVASIPSGMTSFRLYLYTATPPSALTDGTAWTFLTGDRAAFHGFIDIGAPVALSGTLYVELTNINKQIRLAAGSSALYGYIVTNGGFTPGSADPIKLKVHTLLV